jgi:hypothetical protein
MKTKLMLAVATALVLFNVGQLLNNSFSHRLHVDAIPNEETALAVGRAILMATLGDITYEDEPFHAFFDNRNKQWTVSSGWPDNPNLIGTVGAVVLRMSDGKVLGFIIA